MKVITVQDVAKIVRQHGFDQFIRDLIDYLKSDFKRWLEFDKSPRHAIHVDGGVIELMPVADKKYYTFKYVNGHPKNPLLGKLTIAATGQLSSVADGHPLMISEMTALTGFRTAATSAIAAEILSRENSSTLAIIGTGAQSEFQALAHCLVRGIKVIKYYDIDSNAMNKFYNNMKDFNVELIACDSAQDAVSGSDIVVVCTACKDHVDVVLNEWVEPGMHISGLGGDCPGKTELELPILYRSKVVVEFIPQSLVEGEIQRLSASEARTIVHAELWEILTHQKVGRISADEVTVFDSVGFALEDYSVLRLVYDLANKYNLGQDLDLVPQIKDPKNLISVLDIVEISGKSRNSA